MNIYKYIDYLFYSSHEILKLIYKIDSPNKIRIFGEEFFEIMEINAQLYINIKLFLCNHIFYLMILMKKIKKIKNLKNYCQNQNIYQIKVVCFMIINH